MTRGMIIRSNMITAGYTSRIPIPRFDETTKDELSRNAKASYIYAQKGDIHDEQSTTQIDKLIFEHLGLSETDQDTVSDFVNDVVRLT